jgi:dTDP-4-amino-4,6-dideoxygalactose transaminase
VEKRDELAGFLKSKGIETGIHYPTALPFMPAYKYLGHKAEDFPVAHKYQGDIISLPMFPELKKQQIEYIANGIKEFYR